MNIHVVAILVAYNSDIDRMGKSLNSLTCQCRVVVVDNSTKIELQEISRKATLQAGAFFLPLGDNFGIAHAQNVGVAWAREQGADYILLMDDDSIPTHSFVADLLEVRKKSQLHHVVVSARTISENGIDLSNRVQKSSVGLTPCTELTSSGTLVPATVFDLVGIFDEQLFIDCVDFEWGWRALALGVPLFLCDSVAIHHRLGEGSKMGLKIPSPIRHYYQYRNVLKMIFHSKAPLQWRLSQLVKLPVKLILIVLLAGHRIDRLRYAAFGIYDFLVGRNGKYDH